MKFLLIYYILCLGQVIQAQNLVSNGNFEIYSPCPTATSSQSNMQINYALGWTQSTLTPDYFNACAGVGNSVDVPYSFHGYQKDCCGGGGYAGGYMFFDDTANDGREYITQYLQDTLKTGHRYLASMYISRADFDYSIATAGMLFTDTSTYLSWPQGFIPATPQVLSNVLLSDTLNWVLVQDTFVASGNKTILTIGNFNTNATSDSVRSQGTWGYYGAAYYYIDGVGVYDVTGGACNSYWDAGFDKYITAGDSIRLGAINTDNSTFLWQNSIGGGTYLSSNADARPWGSPTVTTTYYVTKTCPNNSAFLDTVTVYVQQPIGVNELINENAEVKIIPNPSHGNFILECSLKENASMEITDISGKLVSRYNLEAANSRVEIKNDQLENGIYLYRIIAEAARLKTGKIVVLK